MDAATRQKIMQSLLPKANESVSTESANEVATVNNQSDDGLFKFRKQLKFIRAYERIVKEDAEDWEEEDWSKFMKWYDANKPKSKTGSLITSAFEKKLLREKTEEANKSAIRKQILEKVKMKFL